MVSLTRDLTDPEFKKIPPSPLAVFKNIQPSEHIYLPEIPRNRRCTNVFFLFPAALIVFGWIGFSIYVMQIYNVNRFLNGEDECGNICGMNNVEVKREDCEAKDYTNYPIAWYESPVAQSTEARCVKDCEEKDRLIILNRCVVANYITRDLSNLLEMRGKTRHYLSIRDDIDPETFTYVVFDILFQNGVAIFSTILITTALCFLLLVGFRYCTACTFWSFIVLLGIILFIVTILSWYGFVVGGAISALLLGIIFSVCMIFYLIFLWYIFKTYRYLLVIAILTEASIAIFKIPMSFMAPIMSILFLFGVVYGFSFYMIMALLSPTEEDALMTRGLYIFVWLTAAYFLHALVDGCQCMVVAGCVTSYYFTKNKTSVGNQAFWNSIYVTTMYHLGTVCAAALIMTIMAIIRYTIDAFARRAEDEGETCTQIVLEAVSCCCEIVEEIVKYIAKKAYIMTAIHGKGLLDSGKRAMRLIWYFLLDIIFIDCVAGCTMFIASCFIFIVSLAVSLAMVAHLEHFIKIFLLPMAILNGIIIHHIVTMLNVAIETIFLCMCEDMMLNDGSSQKPYFMTARLAEIKTLLLTMAQEAQELREEQRLERQRAQRRRSSSL